MSGQDLRRFLPLKRGPGKRLPHVFDWDLAPCAGREIFQFEGTVLNASEPGHFMPQRLEQSSD